MTDHHNVIFHLILAGMIASLVSILVDKHSLYDHLKVQYIKELNDTNSTSEGELNEPNLGDTNLEGTNSTN